MLTLKADNRAAGGREKYKQEVGNPDELSCVTIRKAKEQKIR